MVMIMARQRTGSPVVSVGSEREVPLLMTTGEVARMCRVHPSTVTRWRQLGEGPPVIWVSAHLPRYARSQVVAWLDQVGS